MPLTLSPAAGAARTAAIAARIGRVVARDRGGNDLGTLAPDGAGGFAGLATAAGLVDHVACFDAAGVWAADFGIDPHPVCTGAPIAYRLPPAAIGGDPQLPPSADAADAPHVVTG